MVTCEMSGVFGMKNETTGNENELSRALRALCRAEAEDPETAHDLESCCCGDCFPPSAGAHGSTPQASRSERSIQQLSARSSEPAGKSTGRCVSCCLLADMRAARPHARADVFESVVLW